MFIYSRGKIWPTTFSHALEEGMKKCACKGLLRKTTKYIYFKEERDNEEKYFMEFHGIVSYY